MVFIKKNQLFFSYLEQRELPQRLLRGGKNNQENWL
jgi:hypothetical protein